MIEFARKHLWVAGLAALVALPGGAGAQLSSLPPVGELKLTHVTERLVAIDKPPYRLYVLNTPGGLVVIDTQPTVALTRTALRMAQKEFKRNEVAWLINTHEHMDHVAGNGALPGVPILASAGTLEGLKASAPLLKTYLARADQVLATARAQRDSLPRGSAAADSASRRIADAEAIVAQGRLELVLPTVTFTDRMTLRVGDRTLELVAAGRRHSLGDMLIHIPEEHVLFTVGTANAAGNIPYITNISRPEDIQRVIAVFTEFSDTALGLTHVLTGHGPELKPGDIVFARDYYRRLWQDVARVQREGGTLDQAKQQLALETELKDILPPGAVPDASRNTHRHNIDMVWALVTPVAEKAAPR